MKTFEHFITESKWYKGYWVKGDTVLDTGDMDHQAYLENNLSKMGIERDKLTHFAYETALQMGWIRVNLSPGPNGIQLTYEMETKSQAKDILKNYHKMGVTKIYRASGDVYSSSSKLAYLPPTDRFNQQFLLGVDEG